MVEEKAPELIQKPSPEEPIKTITPPAKKERKKKEKPKNPVSFTPVKKNLNRYTVSGNVNSKGTKYRVTEIIDAQDDKIANSIFKERVKKSMGGIRNITKVIVEAFKEGDEAGKEEIVENLPKSEPVQIEKEKKQPLKKDLIKLLDKAVKQRDYILTETVKRVSKRNDIYIFRLIIRDKISEKHVAEGLCFALQSEIDKAKEKEHLSSAVTVEDPDFVKVASRVAFKKLMFLMDIYVSKKDSCNVGVEIIESIDNLDVKEAQKVLNVIEGDSRELKQVFYNTTNEIAEELGLDMSILNNVDIKVINKEDLI